MHDATKVVQVATHRKATQLKEDVEELFNPRKIPEDVGVEIIDAVQEFQRLNPEKIKKLFAGSGMDPEKAEWADVLLSEAAHLDYVDVSHRNKEKKQIEWRKKVDNKEPKEKRHKTVNFGIPKN